MHKQIIGLSIEGCIKDILAGKIEEESVAKIHTKKVFLTDKDEESFIDCCKRNYWNKNPRKGEEIFLRFKESGKITNEPPKGITPSNKKKDWVAA